MMGGYGKDKGHIEGWCIGSVAIIDGILLVLVPEHLVATVDIEPYIGFSARFDGEGLE